MTIPRNLFWDSCVFIRWLTRQPDELVQDIEQYIEEARTGRVRIYFSTIAYAEIRPRFLRASGGLKTVNQLFNDLGGALTPIEPSPNIMIAAGQLKDAVSTNPSAPKTPPEKQRVVGTADAIHLMTCTYARDVLGISDIVFQTFDDGKGKTWEGSCVPILTFERWYPEATRCARVREVCSLPRSRPQHTRPDLVTTASMAAVPQTKTVQ